MFKLKDTTIKVTYTRKNISDIFEALIGSTFLNSNTLHFVHDLLENKVFFYGTKYTEFLETIAVMDQNKFQIYLDVFCTNHKYFLDWVYYSHPDKFRAILGIHTDIVKILDGYTYMQNLDSKPDKGKQKY